MGLRVGDVVNVQDKDGNDIDEMPCMSCDVMIEMNIGKEVVVILDDNNLIIGAVCDLCESVEESRN